MLFCDKLNEHKKFVIANQLLRAALSIGANVREAQNSESIEDLIHKMKIASKEGDESEFYLQLIEKAYSYEEPKLLLNELVSINKVLNKIISTTKAKIKVGRDNNS
jgi:four helix bundle protein